MHVTLFTNGSENPCYCTHFETDEKFFKIISQILKIEYDILEDIESGTYSFFSKDESIFVFYINDFKILIKTKMLETILYRCFSRNPLIY